MAIREIEWRAYDLGAFRVLVASKRTDLTAPVGVTYLEGGQVITTDVVPGNEARAFTSRLLAQGYVASEVKP